jgi:hypothetical protein
MGYYLLPAGLERRSRADPRNRIHALRQFGSRPRMKPIPEAEVVNRQADLPHQEPIIILILIVWCLFFIVNDRVAADVRRL